MCRSRRELSKAYFLAKFGFDTAENEPCKHEENLAKKARFRQRVRFLEDVAGDHVCQRCRKVVSVIESDIGFMENPDFVRLLSVLPMHRHW